MNHQTSLRQKPRRSTINGLCMLAVLSFSACDPGGVDLVDPRGGDNGVEPTVFALTAAASSDSGLDLAAAGWEIGIPDASVELLRVRDYEPIIRNHGETDSEGIAAFTGLSSGLRWVAAERRLSEEESSVLPPGADVPFLGGGIKVNVAGNASAEVELRPARTGSMVISEIAMIGPLPWEMDGASYFGGMYIELFNNADHTIYLDGMLLGKYYHYHKDYSHNNHHSCAASEPMRVDPEGVWSAFFFQFPGSGSEHPVAPGQVILVAMSATDQSHLHPMLPDLSHADFEFAGGGADNPDAPRMLDVGPRPFDPHFFTGSSNQWYIADRVDVAGLLKMPDPAANQTILTFARIPRDVIHDAPSVWWDNGEAYTPSGGSPLCLYTVHPDFDAVPGGFVRGDRADLSAQRRAVRTRDGRIVLLDTNVSAVDFVLDELTPGWIPEVEQW